MLIIILLCLLHNKYPDRSSVMCKNLHLSAAEFRWWLWKAIGRSGQCQRAHGC